MLQVANVAEISITAVALIKETLLIKYKVSALDIATVCHDSFVRMYSTYRHIFSGLTKGLN